MNRRSNTFEKMKKQLDEIALKVTLKDDSNPLGWMDYDPDYVDYEYPPKKKPGLQAKINKIASHLDLFDLPSKKIISDRSWNLFELLYEYIGGFHSYSSPLEMAKEAYYIRAVYDGKLNSIQNFEIEKCYAIATYNLNHGLKMTALASNSICLDKLKVKAAIRKLQQESFRFSWLECSGKAEKFVMSVGGGSRIIDPNIIKNQVYRDREVIISEDNKHYYRTLTGSGKLVQKIAVGTIRL